MFPQSPLSARVGQNCSCLTFLLVALAGAMAILPAGASAETVRWRKDPAAAQHEASRTGRSVLVYVGSESCGYCRKLERDTWSDRQIAGILGQRFVPLRVDGYRGPGEMRAFLVESLRRVGSSRELAGHVAR